MKRVMILAFSLFLILDGLAGLADSAEKEAKKGPIKIGSIWDFTGTVAEDARRCSLGLKMVIDEVNAAGGLFGRRLEVIFRDSKQQAGVGAREARDLIYDSKVDFLAGNNNSGVALAISEVAKEAKLIYINGGAKTRQITEGKGHRYVFSPGANSRTCAGGQAYVHAREPHTKYALMCGDYAFGHDYAEDFEQVLKKLNPKAEIVGKLWPKFGEKDFTSYITLLMSLNPDLIFSAVWGGDLVTFIKQAKPYGLFQKTALSCTGTQSVLDALGKDMPEGIYFNLEYHFMYPGNISQAFGKKYYNYTGIYADGMSYNGWICATTLIEGIKKAGKTETEAVIKALEEMSLMTPVGVKTTIRGCDHQGNVCNISGKTKFVPEYPNVAVLGDFVYPDPTKLMISCDEVKRVREAAK
jgi:branched-chain amino acid transport system substrate-binding protein